MRFALLSLDEERAEGFRPLRFAELEPEDRWILGRLLRRAWFYWQPRVGLPIWNMQYAFRGPMVVLVDEWTASDGEAFAEALVRLQRRYGFDGVLVNLPGRDPQWRRHVVRVETVGRDRHVVWRNGRVTIAGASKGEGLGNQFLANIRETDAIAHVVRCFQDENVIHVANRIDPANDIEVINTELALADLESADRQLQRVSRVAKGGDKEAIRQKDLLERLLPRYVEIEIYHALLESGAQLLERVRTAGRSLLTDLRTDDVGHPHARLDGASRRRRGRHRHAA